ncbi:TPA: RNA 2'-phosphotransferase [Clostridioides difficile]|uniref:RNA 2'-phosphotransferase n=2 Tax=Clostridioides difficile TaxID=1496 RepID=A0ACA7UNW4_CLODI|nr:RNA 2'-phosphotransferase [Clostridioides difficile]YP_009221720.1 RNA 2'-phosphotransferase [Clostridium phage phiCD211]AKP44796.1 putative RNA 2'-phosphotransferase [Peptoclostridium phage phiCDIF1296T]OFU31691.1 RNA 2'-phosphotransferase [Clostridium sp. HMSC19B12]CCL67188.1 putative RNA 2'-phosphotransferase [Clostridioides difficile E7]ARC16960.1 RNA 2'-phosphotransferase [Clostridioides difficile]AVI14421.1 RNA 2'-phosphotransferase [Clostridioides difficile]
MSKKDKLSIFISLILRHKPETIGIKLDDYGYADVNELIEKINNTGRNINIEILEQIVKEDNKQRYSFNDDRSKIRANQGHSINVNVELRELEPPKYLYHGTATRFLDNIKNEGIIKQSRLYVHLSRDIDIAVKVGKRHGTPVILKINTGKMYENGYKFYLSENNVWLCEYIPFKYVEIFE